MQAWNVALLCQVKYVNKSYLKCCLPRALHCSFLPKLGLHGKLGTDNLPKTAVTVDIVLVAILVTAAATMVTRCSKIISQKRQNPDSHTDRKRTWLKDFFYSSWRDLLDVITHQSEVQKSTNLHRLQECWNECANAGKTPLAGLGCQRTSPDQDRICLSIDRNYFCIASTYLQF